MSLIRMMKRFTKASIRCVVVVYEEINANVWKENDPKMTKAAKISKFLRFYAIFVKFSIDFVDENVENVQHGTNSLSSRLFR